MVAEYSRSGSIEPPPCQTCRRSLLPYLGQKYQTPVGAEDLMAYIAGVVANPAYTARFEPESGPARPPGSAHRRWRHVRRRRRSRTVRDLATHLRRAVRRSRPGPTVGASPSAEGSGPPNPRDGAIPPSPDAMPDAIAYDEATGRLLIGQGYVERVTPAMWRYEVSGKHVLRQWFSYRKANRERPIIGDRRPPSKLGDIQPDHWLAEYTTELINVLHVIGRLVELEPSQAALLERVCAGPTIPVDELRAAGALTVPPGSTRRTGTADSEDHPRLFD